MKRIVLLVIIFFSQVGKISAQVADKLAGIGMENIQVYQTENGTVASFENNRYRGTYRGIGKAIVAGMEGTVSGRLELVALENNIPQICITLPDTLITMHKQGKVSLMEVYKTMSISYDTEQAIKKLKREQEVINSSTWKTDIVLYPEVFMENSGFRELYTYAVNLSPAVKVSPWKGGMITAQVVFPIATNLYGEYRKIRPGIMTVSQDMRFRNNFFGRLVMGNFTNNRIGVQAEIKYYLNNGRINVGAMVGTTGYSAITGGKWYIGTKQRVNAVISASVYEPRSNLQIDVQGIRFLYGDYGIRGDCTRHFGEYTVGLYALYTKGEINGGFHFDIPIPGKKRSSRRNIRIMQPEYFSWQYSMVSWGDYIDRSLGRSYSSRTDNNKSESFYQPDYIRYFLIKELQKHE